MAAAAASIDDMVAVLPVPETDTTRAGVSVRMMEAHGQWLRVAVHAPHDARRRPLLLFNGIGANLELALPFMKAIRGRATVIFDIPGVGGSPLSTLPYRPSTIARMAREVMRQLGHHEHDVSGVSWGGGMAQQYARQYKRVCRRLVLVATSAGWTMVPGKPNVLSKMANPRRYTEPGYMRSIAADIYGGDFRDDGQAIAPHISGMKPVTGRAYLYQLMCMTGWTSLPWLWRLKMPTLVMAGTDDPLIPVANARLLARAIPNARLHLVDNGHLFMVTRPDESAATVEAFLRD